MLIFTNIITNFADFMQAGKKPVKSSSYIAYFVIWYPRFCSQVSLIKGYLIDYPVRQV